MFIVRKTIMLQKAKLGSVVKDVLEAEVNEEHRDSAGSIYVSPHRLR